MTADVSLPLSFCSFCRCSHWDVLFCFSVSQENGKVTFQEEIKWKFNLWYGTTSSFHSPAGINMYFDEWKEDILEICAWYQQNTHATIVVMSRSTPEVCSVSGGSTVYFPHSVFVFIDSSTSRPWSTRATESQANSRRSEFSCPRDSARSPQRSSPQSPRHSSNTRRRPCGWKRRTIAIAPCWMSW